MVATIAATLWLAAAQGSAPRPMPPSLDFTEIEADFAKQKVERSGPVKRSVWRWTSLVLLVGGAAVLGVALATKYDLTSGSPARPMSEKTDLISRAKNSTIAAGALGGGAVLAFGVSLAF